MKLTVWTYEGPAERGELTYLPNCPGTGGPAIVLNPDDPGDRREAQPEDRRQAKYQGRDAKNADGPEHPRPDPPRQRPPRPLPAASTPASPPSIPWQSRASSLALPAGAR